MLEVAFTLIILHMHQISGRNQRDGVDHRDTEEAADILLVILGP